MGHCLNLCSVVASLILTLLAVYSHIYNQLRKILSGAGLSPTAIMARLHKKYVQYSEYIGGML